MSPRMYEENAETINVVPYIEKTLMIFQTIMDRTKSYNKWGHESIWLERQIHEQNLDRR